MAVFGATGRTGRPLVEQALGRGVDVVAFVRDASGLDVDHEHLTVVEGDAYTGTNVAEAVAPGGDPVDAVVSVLGQSDETPDDLLTVAGRNVMAAMRDHGVDRYVTLTGAGVRTDRDDPSLGGRAMNAVMKLVARDVLADASTHAKAVADSDLRWTIVRPPRLTEDAATGEYAAGYLRLGARERLPREDLATFLLDCVEDGTYVGDLPNVTN
ncbi:NAD(P)H-binding protein [Halomarina oriensis]|uniref:NAD(P)H-binding protein n=1 Tax=Halomarina oriensis TaxID=671145 RepID=A0A6B0GV50_9EURY|nr:NAD(P)H-binding protein [Halomarina oriensis]